MTTKEKVEQERNKLNEMITRLGFEHPDVIAQSQVLDDLVLQEQTELSNQG